MAVVYKHTHDDGTIFYIGIGKKLKRAYTKDRRSPIWKYAVNKYGLNVEILHEDVSWEEACIIEQELIKQYGRKVFGEGTLVNLTEGGEGQLGLKASEETKSKMSKAHIGLNTWSKGRVMSEEQKQHMRDYISKNGAFARGTRSKEVKQKISQALKGRKPNYLGCKHTEEQRKKISNSKKGEKHHLYGKTHNEDTKQKMREKALNLPKFTCPHCNTTARQSVIKRWHLNNCKNLKQ
jgi:hypothetical protein